MKLATAILALLFVGTAFGQEMTGMDGKKSAPVLVRHEADGDTYIAAGDLQLIHDRTCPLMMMKRCAPHWLNSQFQFKTQVLLTKPDNWGVKTVVYLYLTDTAHAELVEQVATGFDAAGKQVWQTKGPRETVDLNRPGSEGDLNLVLNLCRLLESRETLADKQLQYYLDQIPR